MSVSRRAQLDVFLRECKLVPHDDAPRLILADWLQDQNDPRGELIYLQVCRARLGEADPAFERYRLRELRLLAQHCLRWLGSLVDRCARWTFHRGLIELEARAERFLVPEVFALAGREELLWVEELKLTGVEAHHLARIAGSPVLDDLAALDLADNHLGQALPLLFEAPAAWRWRGLALGGNRVGDRVARALADCPALARLQALDLSRNQIAGAGARALAESPYLAGLRSLDLRGNPLDGDGGAALRARFGEAVCLVRG